MLIDFLLIVLDKLIGGLLPFLRRKVVVSPRYKKIKTSRDIQDEYRYFLFLINQKDRPFYNVNLYLYAKAENVPAKITIKPNLDGQGYKPTYPIGANNSQNQPTFDIGFMGFFNTDEKHFSYNLRINHIEPKETKKLEVVISNLKPNRKFKVRHKLSFQNEPISIEIKKEYSLNQSSVSVQGLNWKIKK